MHCIRASHVHVHARVYFVSVIGDFICFQDDLQDTCKSVSFNMNTPLNCEFFKACGFLVSADSTQMMSTHMYMYIYL